MKNLSLLMFALAIFGLAFAPVQALAKEGLAVVVVDVQGDFTTAHKGSLAVPNSDQAYLERRRQSYRTVEEGRSSGLRHPGLASGRSICPLRRITRTRSHLRLLNWTTGATQVLWPAHCVQGTKGSEILVNPALFTKVIRKGMNSKFDSYSGFMDDGGAKTDLDKVLKAAGVKTLIVYGIATDYCVKATALDGLKDGYKVIVVQDLCRGVADETSNAALEEMKQKGAQIWPSLDLDKIKNL